MGVAMRVPRRLEGLRQERAALDYASALHQGQVRKIDGAPFISHPREVAELLHRAGAPDHLCAAGALHDVIEKTPATATDLRRRFGSKVASLVSAVSEDERIASYAERKAALRAQVAAAGEEALILFAADKISKARELRVRPLRGAGIAKSDGSRRLANYRRSLALLREQLPNSPLVEELAEELCEVSRESSAEACASSPRGRTRSREAADIKRFAPRH
jgi:hypothetical protein